MLKIILFTEPGDFTVLGTDRWHKLLKSKKSLHQPGIASEIKRPYYYEPVVFNDGTVHVALDYPRGENRVLVEQPNFVAVWGYEIKPNKFSGSGATYVTWFRYYYTPEAVALPPSISASSVAADTDGGKKSVVSRRGRKPAERLTIHRLIWSQLGSSLQQEILGKWQEVAPDWMQEPERVRRYRPGQITSKRAGKIPSLNADAIAAADPTAIEIDVIVVPVECISDADIML